MAKSLVPNPFRPGAGHTPPYLAGRQQEKQAFLKILEQNIILQNFILTGLRGVGKTVLLETFKPEAIQQDWLWVGTDLSESISLNEERIAIRLMADLAPLTSAFAITQELPSVGFRHVPRIEQRTLNYETLLGLFQGTPGLVADKLKRVLELAWDCLRTKHVQGVVFAYDEAQNLSDHAADSEFPLSLMLEVFQSLQKKEIPFLLVLVGLPTLFPKLVEARTFAERMFHVEFLNRLSDSESRDAILKPISDNNCPVQLDDTSVQRIIEFSGGYPYFIQFICREVYDTFLLKLGDDMSPSVPVDDIMRKLDNNFFAGRWAHVTDRQRALLTVIANLPGGTEEFTVQEVATHSKKSLEKPFSPSHVNQMLATLSENGLVYKNRHGKYSFAVPLLARFIQRQQGQK